MQPSARESTMNTMDLPSPHKRLKSDHDPSSVANISTASHTQNISHVEQAGKMHAEEDAHHDQEDQHDPDPYSKELSCGIVEYVNPHSQGFSGILKKR